MRNSLQTRLIITFIGLAIIPLVLVGLGLGWQSFEAQRIQALILERQIAQRVAEEMRAFIKAREQELRLLTEIRGLQSLDRAQQTSLLTALLSSQNVYEVLILLNSQGAEEIHLSRLEIVLPDQLGNWAGADEFEIPKATAETYYSSVQFDQVTAEPFMTIAIPLIDLRTGRFDGVLVAQFRLKAVWDLMARARGDDSGAVYAIDAQNRIIAHNNPSLVLKETLFDLQEAEGFQQSPSGQSVIFASHQIQLGEQIVDIVAEKPAGEALDLASNTIYITVAAVIVALLVATGLSFLAVRQIVRPIRELLNTAQAISGGDLSRQVAVASQDEVGQLADAFNNMALRLRAFIDGLEGRIQERTRRLETVATLSERLSSILHLETLLSEIVNQIVQNFDYYHTHIYLLDQTETRLVVAEGTGPAGAELKARQHSISVTRPTSLVARAARSGEVVSVQNVRESPDWLPNELLPHTYAEMAVPIILAGKVVGVLDVQEDEIGGLDEGDATLLRSLAGQIAVAIHNARLFAEVERSLADTRRAQERYVEQVWQKSERSASGGRYYYVAPGAAPLDEAKQQIMHKATQQALNQARPTIIKPDDLLPPSVAAETDPSGRSEVVTAPVTIQGQMIGALHLHPGPNGRKWTPSDLLTIEAVINQLAQTAENLRLFEETRERASFDRLVRDITQRIRQAPNLEILTKTAAEALSEVLGASEGVVRLDLGSDPHQAQEGNGHAQ